MTTQNNFDSVQFGVCVIENNEERYYLIPVDNSVQLVLKDMLISFNDLYNCAGDKKREYEPSEKYASSEKIYLPTDDDNITKLKALFNNNNIQTNNINISETLSEISFYFAVFNSGDDKIIGVKRPTQFKGLLKKKNKLIQIVDDTLKSVNDDIFKLDNDFDFIITEYDVNILHPAGFVFISDADKYVMTNAIKATKELNKQIAFIKFDNLSKFVGKSKTAAKLVASIRSRNDLDKIQKTKLIKSCKIAGIELKIEGKMIEPDEDGMLDFLRLLDRRLYDMELTNEKELYIAESRHKK